MACPECDRFVGRPKAICNGTSGLPLATANTYRERWGLPPLQTPVLPVLARPPRLRAERKGGTCSGCAGTILDRAKRLAAAAIDFWRDGMAIATPEQQAYRLAVCESCPLKQGNTCADCGCNLPLKVKARAAECPNNRWFRYHDNYRPLINPTRNLLWHIYPKATADWNWKWHCEQIQSVANKFNGTISIAVATGPGLSPPEQVEDCLQGVPVSRWIVRANDATAETGTLPLLLETVKTDDPNSITFRGHCKGVTHKRDSIEQEWARLMWSACTDFEAVEDALKSHLMAGPLKCHEPLVSKQRYKWFYAGSFYWFRNREIFQRDWATMEQTRWYVEAWPGVICSNEEAANLCHDFTDGSVLRPAYWRSTVDPAFEKWKAARG